MTAPVFLIDPGALAEVSAGATVHVTGDEARHAVAAMRLTPGEPVEVVDGHGRRVIGTVSTVAVDAMDVLVAQVVDEELPRPRVTVVQALVKGDRSESAVEMLTECGVDRIVAWSADRSVPVWRGERALKGMRRWRAVARAATKQSRRARVPEITGPMTSGEVARLMAAARLVLVLHEEAAARLAHVRMPDEGEVILVVGPEGGISDEEVEMFADAGGLSVRMGASILRTSTAGIAAAAVVMARSGRWN